MSNPNIRASRVARAKLSYRSALAAGLLAWTSIGIAPAAQSPPIATVALTPGWATFGQAVPPGAARDGLKVRNLPTQADIKNRWPDGSIRFAIVTVYAPVADSYDVTPAAAAGGTFTPFLPTASVALTIGGATYTAALPNTPSTDLWLSGPLAYEARTVVAPVSGGGSAHPFLRVNFDTRVYDDGKARLDVSVENLLDKAGATTVTYNVAIVVNGQTVFTRAGVQHSYLTRWRKVFETGASTLAAITPDIAPFNKSNALPPYLPLVSNVVSAPTGSTYDILGPGALNPDMQADGVRVELAPL